jgi:hypothetical protein
MDLATKEMNCSRPASGVATSAAGGTDTTDTCVETCQGVPAGTSPACTKPTISAFDHHDGDLTDVIKFQTEFNTAGANALQTLSSTAHAFSDIDFAVCGKYTVTLEVSDAAENEASTNEAKDTLIIYVEDTTPPVITAFIDTWTQEAACTCSETDSTMSQTYTLLNDATCTDELAPTDKAIEYTRTGNFTDRRSGVSDGEGLGLGVSSNGLSCNESGGTGAEFDSAPLGQNDTKIIQECGYDYNFCGSTQAIGSIGYAAQV